MVETHDLAARVLALEERVGELSDRLEIHRLIASYAPAIDAGDADRVAALWTEDGVYDVDVGVWTGQAAIAGMVRDREHQSVMGSGSGHVISYPYLTIRGAHAVATCHSRLYVQKESGFAAWRVAANRWEFVRTPSGWRISRRTNRLLDGASEARALLASGFAIDGQTD